MSGAPIELQRGVKRSLPIANDTARGDVDILDFTPLGGGQEVGRSCHILKFKGKTIMLDCGVHPAYSGLSCLPFFDVGPKASEIDMILISHFHLDHAAALPYFLANTDFKGKVYMTHPTKSIFKLILDDYVKVSGISVEEQLYDQKDLVASMDRIDVVNYHEVVHHKGIKFWSYTAGHVLGAAMFMIEIAGTKILYTGDYSRKADRHLCAAEIPEMKPDVLVVEATYGVRELEPIKKREEQFVQLVRNIVYEKKGHCLIPVFALGKAQELLLIVEEYWKKHKVLQDIPIYYASALASRCMVVYQTYTNMMNQDLKEATADGHNPFHFRFVQNLRGIQDLDTSSGSPCVIFASPGFLQNGLSRKLLELWCHDHRNGVIVAGYCVEGTLAHELMKEPKTITSLSGATLPLNMSVHYAEFSAHADWTDTREFVDVLKPRDVILVHGQTNEMKRVQRELEAKYNKSEEDDEDDSKEENEAMPDMEDALTRMSISAPQNTQRVELEFRKNKIARAVGSLVETPLDNGDTVSGLLVDKDFVYTLIAPDDLSEYTNLVASQVRQRLTIPFRLSMEVLKLFVGNMFAIEDGISDGKDGGTKGEAKVIVTNTVMLFCGGLHAVENEKGGEEKSIILQWESNPVDDMIADAVIALLRSMERNPGAAKAMGVSSCSHDHSHREADKDAQICEKRTLLWYLARQFGEANVVSEGKNDEQCLVVKCDTQSVVVRLSDDEILYEHCVNAEPQTIQAVTRIIERVRCSEYPLQRKIQ